MSNTNNVLNLDSILWAIKFLQKHSDGDLFPKILELDAISEEAKILAKNLYSTDLSQIGVAGKHRRFLVPKDDLSYRQATQLDIQDSIILSSIIHQYGTSIEKRRLSSDIIFSYRFSPDMEHGFYSNNNGWNSFWITAYNKSFEKIVLYCDIADFYNQLYHHTIENQLIESKLPNKVAKWIIELLGSTTAKVSRGIPVGPHSAHLLAETAMIPIDNSLQIQGIDFIRYVDDIIVFCESESDARLMLHKIATTLDQQQRLILQQHKTKIFKAEEFRLLCDEMIKDRPISRQEDQILKLINKYSKGDPYRIIFYNDISDEDWNSISDEIITNIIIDYLSESAVQFDRLRWFYRRLTQVGHPGGINVTLDNIEKLMPCFANVCMYLGSVQEIPSHKWVFIGKRLLALFQTDVVQSNEYFRLLILSIFTKNKHINHFTELVQAYQRSEAFIRREIILAAKQNNANDWLREQKDSYNSMDPWQQMAFIFSISDLPRDERKFFIKYRSSDSYVMNILFKWTKEQ